MTMDEADDEAERVARKAVALAKAAKKVPNNVLAACIHDLQ